MKHWFWVTATANPYTTDRILPKSVRPAHLSREYALSSLLNFFTLTILSPSVPRIHLYDETYVEKAYV